jgi:pimeloyl-ACP methyl ester carboxylesterase
MKGPAGAIWTESLASEKQRILAEIAERGLPVPTLHIWGANDKSWYTPLGLKLFDIIRQKTPTASAHVVNHSGHYVFREQTDDFVRMAKLWCLGLA